MTSTAATPEEYLESLPEDRKLLVSTIRDVLIQNLPTGFTEIMSYGMLGYVVPHSIYPKGYHVNPKLPLGLINLASQKNNVTLYHMGMYEGKLLTWFKENWALHSNKKLDMGKCCIHFKKLEDVPLELIAELATKLTPQKWIDYYEDALISRK
jgi:hypothetical protein